MSACDDARTPTTKHETKPLRQREANRRYWVSIVGGCIAIICIWQVWAAPADKSEFPDGYDAVQAAPDSHKVIFENAIVRVLQVPIPLVGRPVPMHHHRWPSLSLYWDTGGKTPHIRYHRADGSARDIPSKDVPVHAGQWVVNWMPPEPMHWIETVDYGTGQEPPYIRVEIKVAAVGE